MDITDRGNIKFFRAYKYDIPVLHIQGEFFAKHIVKLDEVIRKLEEAKEMSVCRPREGEPTVSADVSKASTCHVMPVK